MYVWRHTCSVGLNSNINSQIYKLFSEVGWSHRARAGTAYHHLVSVGSEGPCWGHASGFNTVYSKSSLSGSGKDNFCCDTSFYLHVSVPFQKNLYNPSASVGKTYIRLSWFEPDSALTRLHPYPKGESRVRVHMSQKNIYLQVLTSWKVQFPHYIRTKWETKESKYSVSEWILFKRY